MYSGMRNQGLRIINYMINGFLIARLPVKVPWQQTETVMLLFCLSIFVSGSSAVKELMLGCLYKTKKLWSLHWDSGEASTYVCATWILWNIFLMRTSYGGYVRFNEWKTLHMWLGRCQFIRDNCILLFSLPIVMMNCVMVLSYSLQIRRTMMMH
jgi:hypothetical protein